MFRGAPAKFWCTQLLDVGMSWCLDLVSPNFRRCQISVLTRFLCTTLQKCTTPGRDSRGRRMSESGRIGNSRSGPGIWRNPAWNRVSRQDVEISSRNPVSSPDFPPEPRFGLDFLMESDFSSQISRRKGHFSRRNPVSDRRFPPGMTSLPPESHFFQFDAQDNGEKWHFSA